MLQTAAPEAVYPISFLWILSTGMSAFTRTGSRMLMLMPGTARR